MKYLNDFTNYFFFNDFTNYVFFQWFQESPRLFLKHDILPEGCDSIRTASGAAPVGPSLWRREGGGPRAVNNYNDNNNDNDNIVIISIAIIINITIFDYYSAPVGPSLWRRGGASC